MSIEENKEVVRRFFEEVHNQGNYSVLDELFTPDYTAPQAPGVKGPERAKLIPTLLRNGFPDIHTTIDDIVGEGDMVVVRVSSTGTHTGQYAGIPPTGKKVTVMAAHFFRFEGGKIAEAVLVSAGHHLREQLGVLPPTDRKALEEAYEKLQEKGNS